MSLTYQHFLRWAVALSVLPVRDSLLEALREPTIAACKMWRGKACCKPEPRQPEVRFVNVNYNYCVTLPFSRQ